jgi:hypothetical protein
MEYLLIILAIIVTPILVVKYINYNKELLKEIKDIDSKIKNIVSKIKEEIIQRKDEPYYERMVNTHDLKYVPIKLKANKELLGKLKLFLNKADSEYIIMKQNIRTLESFKKFDSSFSYKKRRYKKYHENSNDKKEMIVKDYSSVVLKYLVNFKEDYSYYKENYLIELNNKVKECKKYYKEYNISNLNKVYKNVINLHSCLETELNEPCRLREKLSKAETNVSQLEEELNNKAGCLYHKVFNMIKNNKVSNNQVQEWNKIKRHISNFKKKRLLNQDVIELNKTVNNIINDLTSLSFSIKSQVKQSVNN